MEGFSRELQTGSALFLLYGEASVGKTRLLQEWSRGQLAERQIHWINLGQGSRSEDSLQDNSRNIETTFASARQGDIIIADHFEMALQKTRHQLFVSWSTDGVDQQLNLIVVSSTESFNELRQLSQQYQVRVQSSQLVSFNTDEVEAFVTFYLFPDSPTGKLSIPATLRRQLVATQGTVGKIIDIIEHDGKQIKSSPANKSGSIPKASRVVAMVSMLLLMMIGAGWYYLDNQSASFEPVPKLAVTESDAVTMVAPVAEAEVVPEAGIATEAVEQDVVAEGTGADAETEAVIVTEDNSTQQDSATADETDSSNHQSLAQVELPDTGRFERDLKDSYAWVTSKTGSVGTLQIMLLSFKTFDEAVYYEYVESLAKQQVDIAQLKVFKTYTGGAEVYSVFYGEYASRQIANKAKGKLPEVLRKISPVARSVGGILKEIRRLEAES